jgi:hypothetical protein
MNGKSRMSPLLLLCAGCVVQTIDLRARGTAEEEVVCESGTRLSPVSGACEPCLAEVAPDESCPCGWSSTLAPFPSCEGVATYACASCRGDIEACRGYDAARHVAADCGLLLACCAELRADATSTPCCPGGAQVNCTAGDNLGEYAVACPAGACCAGAACPGGQGDCAVWQTCDAGLGRCVPACQPRVEYCCNECSCQCRRIPN